MRFPRTSNSTRFVMYKRFSVLSFYFIFKNVSTEWLMEIIFFSPTLTSTTLSHRGGKLFYCMFLCIIFWNAKIFYYSYIIKEAKLAKFIRFEAGWKLMWDEVRDTSISITKFSEMWWNDGAFEGSEEHWKLWRREVEIFCFLKRFFTMLPFVQNDTVLFFTYD